MLKPSPISMTRAADSPAVGATSAGRADLVVEGLTKRYAVRKAPIATPPAVDGVSFTVPPGTIFTLLGPSGGGKTTTLRCVAGLETPDAGDIRVGGRPLFSSTSGLSVPANRRGLGMVFQSYAIWPHMTVRQNAAYPLTSGALRRGRSRSQVRARVDQMLSIVELDAFADRRATELSGGQQQRLAFARALIMEPPLLLLDEPLSNLDARLRDQMRMELQRLQRELGITMLYVTHDQSEALALSTSIAVMAHGRIQQIGTPGEVYDSPSSRFVAGFIGISNLISGEVERGADSRVVSTQLGKIYPHDLTGVTGRSDAPVTVCVRPEHLTFATGALDATIPNHWPGKVISRAFLGEVVDHVVQVGPLELRLRCDPARSKPEGSEVLVHAAPEHCRIVPD
jgi:iron(III) transport system ATP-binding protein